MSARRGGVGIGLGVATCQFPVGADVRQNGRHVLRQMRAARRRGADVAHFPEACLPGYAGVDLPSYEGLDWDLLRSCTLEVLDEARRLGLWVILGSAHPLTAPHKPHNSLYVIDDRGRIRDRYDKMFLSGAASGRTEDLAHYSPGDHFCVFDIRGVRCGALICHDYRYPELYREYKRRGVQLVFHSYHAANVSPERLADMQRDVDEGIRRLNPAATIPGTTMPATMIGAAANNHVWISCPNSSARESLWAGFLVRPDGFVAGRLRRNVAGVLISTVDPERPLYDSTVAWRDRAMNGVLHSGTLVRDRRSEDRTRL